MTDSPGMPLVGAWSPAGGATGLIATATGCGMGWGLDPGTDKALGPELDPALAAALTATVLTAAITAAVAAAGVVAEEMAPAPTEALAAGVVLAEAPILALGWELASLMRALRARDIVDWIMLMEAAQQQKVTASTKKPQSIKIKSLLIYFVL